MTTIRNMTGKEIIQYIRKDRDDYLHLSPPYVKAMLSYVNALEKGVDKMRHHMRPVGGKCEGWDDQWCPTSCRWWEVCRELEE